MIFVVGPGRCGTSTIARLLHENMNIDMGKEFRFPDETNPDGFYEDIRFRNLNADLLDGRTPFPDWYARLTGMLLVRDGCSRGLKDPRLCYLLPFYLSLTRWATIIRCKRPVRQVALSMSKCYGWPIDESTAEAERRERLLDLVDYPMNEIDFGYRRTDEEIISKLEPICNP